MYSLITVFVTDSSNCLGWEMVCVCVSVCVWGGGSMCIVKDSSILIYLANKCKCCYIATSILQHVNEDNIIMIIIQTHMNIKHKLLVALFCQ